MGLLGKTLKGRTAREGGLPPKKNIKVRQIAKTQEEFDNLKKLAKMKKDGLILFDAVSITLLKKKEK